MKSRLFTWLGRDFIEISSEGKAGVPPDVATEDLFATCESELRSHGFSLENTVRIRVWGRDKDARTAATAARARILMGKLKAASSSFILQQWFDSDATAGLELLAMKPRDSAAERRPVDFEPARNYLCYLRYDSVVFYSGYTSTADTLEEQISEVLKAITGARAISGALTQDFRKTGRLSVFLHRSQKLSIAKDLLGKVNLPDLANVEFRLVDGFAGDKYLVEIEATALSG
jgi:enamine deaminase RidA (YjgF/YER057c/UK114 family)